MTYYAYDAEGYVGDVASIGGWNDFVTWVEARGKHDALTDFVDEGFSDDPEGLAKVLSQEKAHDSEVEDIRANLVDLAKKADEILIVSDGEEDAEDEEGDNPGDSNA